MLLVLAFFGSIDVLPSMLIRGHLDSTMSVKLQDISAHQSLMFVQVLRRSSVFKEFNFVFTNWTSVQDVYLQSVIFETCHLNLAK